MVKLHKMTAKPTKSSKQKPIPVKIVSEAPNAIGDDKKWRAQDDLRTLQNAEKIRADKERMKMAKDCAKEQMNNLKKIC